MAVNDTELPGMWSGSDFEGGDPDERSYAERNAYTRTDIVADLAWVEGRIAEWTAEGGWVESVAKYQACADELRALLESTPCGTCDGSGEIEHLDTMTNSDCPECFP